MRRPRTPGAGITGAQKSLAGDGASVAHAGPKAQRRCALAAAHLHPATKQSLQQFERSLAHRFPYRAVGSCADVPGPKLHRHGRRRQ
jgi:hypothetical protein